MESATKTFMPAAVALSARASLRSITTNGTPVHAEQNDEMLKMRPARHNVWTSKQPTVETVMSVM